MAARDTGTVSADIADREGTWTVCCPFFFQAEDGIRDVAVTGVQTCALPISPSPPLSHGFRRSPRYTGPRCASQTAVAILSRSWIRGTVISCPRAFGEISGQLQTVDRKSVV